MQPQELPANMIVVGDIITDDGPLLLVLQVEHKPIDGRVRFVLLQGDGGDGLRINRTYGPKTTLRVFPVGAALALRQNFNFSTAVSKFLEMKA